MNLGNETTYTKAIYKHHIQGWVVGKFWKKKIYTQNGKTSEGWLFKAKYIFF